MRFRTLMLPFLACVLGVFPAYAVHAGTPAPNAASAATAGPSAATTKAPTSANLGSINVKATKELIKTLQVVKVALNEPYSTSKDQANVVVCRIVTGHGHLDVQQRMGAVLDCGTNSWYIWRRENCQTEGLAACASDNLLGSAYKRKGAWHSEHPLNLKQVMALRQLLAELPASGKGSVVVVDKNGKPTMTIKADEGSSGNNQP